MKSLVDMIYTVWDQVYLIVFNTWSASAIMSCKIWRKAIYFLNQLPSDVCSEEPKLTKFISECSKLIMDFHLLTPMARFKALKVLDSVMTCLQFNTISREIMLLYVKHNSAVIVQTKINNPEGFLGETRKSRSPVVGYNRCVQLSLLLVLKGAEVISMDIVKNKEAGKSEFICNVFIPMYFYVNKLLVTNYKYGRVLNLYSHIQC